MHESLLKWLSGNLHFVQRMPAAQCPHAGEPKEIVSFCDASWGLDSVSGAVLIYRGCCVKFFSRKQEVPALSSAEAEIISIVETAKEMVSLGMLLQTMIQGIPLDPLRMPLQTTGEMGLTMFNDAKAAVSMGRMDGLLRRVRHLELRVNFFFAGSCMAQRNSLSGRSPFCQLSVVKKNHQRLLWDSTSSSCIKQQKLEETRDKKERRQPHRGCLKQQRRGKPASTI